MNRPEQENSYKIFLNKLLEFTKKITPYKKDRIAMRLFFNEIPAALTQAFCILRSSMDKIDIKIYVRCKDSILWNYLDKNAFYSNSISHIIFIPDHQIDEIIPFLFLNRSRRMLIIDTFFLKFARSFSNKNILYILRYGVNFCLSELLNIHVEEIFPKKHDVLTFHEY
jgi:hypothetical protein